MLYIKRAAPNGGCSFYVSCIFSFYSTNLTINTNLKLCKSSGIFAAKRIKIVQYFNKTIAKVIVLTSYQLNI